MPILEFDRQARPLGPGVLTIGSGPEAGWRVVDHDLAPIHALVTLERDGRAQIARARDDVAILVNGEAMTTPLRLIRAGDVVTLGHAKFFMRAARRQDDASEAAYLRDMSRGRAWRIEDRLDIGRDRAADVDGLDHCPIDARDRHDDPLVSARGRDHAVRADGELRGAWAISAEAVKDPERTSDPVRTCRPGRSIAALPVAST